MNYNIIELVAEVSDASLKWIKVAKYIDDTGFFQHINYEKIVNDYLNEVNLESREIDELPKIMIMVSDVTYDLDCAVESIGNSAKSYGIIHDKIYKDCGIIFSTMVRESNRTMFELKLEMDAITKMEKDELERVKFAEYKLMHDATIRSRKMSEMLESEKNLHAIVSHLSTSEYNKTNEIQEMPAQIEELQRKLAKAKKSRSPKSTHRKARRE